MYNWEDRVFRYGRGKIMISAETFRDTYRIIKESARNGNYIYYSEVMDKLKRLGHRKINRGTIGGIVGEVSIMVANSTNPSVYPSAIVVKKNSIEPGKGFWGLDRGTNPPSMVPPDKRREALSEYQETVFSRVDEW